MVEILFSKSFKTYQQYSTKASVKHNWNSLIMKLPPWCFIIKLFELCLTDTFVTLYQHDGMDYKSLKCIKNNSNLLVLCWTHSNNCLHAFCNAHLQITNLRIIIRSAVNVNFLFPHVSVCQRHITWRHTWCSDRITCIWAPCLKFYLHMFWSVKFSDDHSNLMIALVDESLI
jgi:hypothetical protein